MHPVLRIRFLPRTHRQLRFDPAQKKTDSPIKPLPAIQVYVVEWFRLSVPHGIEVASASLFIPVTFDCLRSVATSALGLQFRQSPLQTQCLNRYREIYATGGTRPCRNRCYIRRSINEISFRIIFDRQGRSRENFDHSLGINGCHKRGSGSVANAAADGPARRRPGVCLYRVGDAPRADALSRHLGPQGTTSLLSSIRRVFFVAELHYWNWSAGADCILDRFLSSISCNRIIRLAAGWRGNRGVFSYFRIAFFWRRKYDRELVAITVGGCALCLLAMVETPVDVVHGCNSCVLRLHFLVAS